MTTKFITLNVWDTYPVRVNVNEGVVNSRFFRAQFIDKNQPLDLEGKTVFFYAKKPDGNLIFNTCEIIDEKDGTVNLAVTSQMSIVAGKMKDCEFQVIDADLSKLKIKGLILWYPAFVIPDDAKRRFEENANTCFGQQLSPDYNKVAKDIDIFNVITGYKGPVVIIHGESDNCVPISSSEHAE